MKKQFNKIWLLSPIILTGILVLLSTIFHWRDLNLGFQLTPSMIKHLGQPANVKLDVDLPQEFILMGNLDITIKHGEQFELWISPFLLNFAEIKNKKEIFSLRSMYVESQKELVEAITIILPRNIPEDLSFVISGNSDIKLENITLDKVVFDLLGNQYLAFENSHINALQLYTKGIAFIKSDDSTVIEQWHIHNMGTLAGNISLSHIHTLKSWGDVDLHISGTGQMKVSGIGKILLNNKEWHGVFRENFLFSPE